MLHTLRFFSSKCRLFHNATFFGSCIIHILHTGCAKILIPNSGAKRLSTPSRADCNVGEPHLVGSTFGSLPLTGCLPTNLVTHSSGRLHRCFQLNCCQTQKVRLTCYQAHHTIHSLKISFGSWLHLSHVDYHGTTYAHFVNYLHRPG